MGDGLHGVLDEWVVPSIHHFVGSLEERETFIEWCDDDEEGFNFVEENHHTDTKDLIFKITNT